MSEFLKDKNGLDGLDQAMFGAKLVKALSVFKNHKTMNEKEAEDEFWSLQDSIDNMSLESAEGFEGEIITTRQSLLNTRFEELTGASIL